MQGLQYRSPDMQGLQYRSPDMQGLQYRSPDMQGLQYRLYSKKQDRCWNHRPRQLGIGSKCGFDV
jgi:hypothetical protein